MNKLRNKPVKHCCEWTIKNKAEYVLPSDPEGSLHSDCLVEVAGLETG